MSWIVYNVFERSRQSPRKELRSIRSSCMSSATSLRAVFTLGKRKYNHENWDCLGKSAWSLGTMWVSVASAHPWVSEWVGRTLRRSTSSVNLHDELDESPPYWYLIHLPPFREPINISCHHFTDICVFVCISRGSKTPAYWIRLQASSTRTVCNMS
jgi:hypothetical protein